MVVHASRDRHCSQFRLKGKFVVCTTPVGSTLVGELAPHFVLVRAELLECTLQSNGGFQAWRLCP